MRDAQEGPGTRCPLRFTNANQAPCHWEARAALRSDLLMRAERYFDWRLDALRDCFAALGMTGFGKALIKKINRPTRGPVSFMAGGRGFEPRLTESESAVLPLDDPPKTGTKRLLTYVRSDRVSSPFRAGLRPRVPPSTTLTYPFCFGRSLRPAGYIGRSNAWNGATTAVRSSKNSSTWPVPVRV